MTAGALLDEVREYYLKCLREAVAEHRGAGAEVATEAAYRNHTGDVVGEGPYDLPARTDLFVISAGQVTEAIDVDTEGMLSFTPIEFQWGAAVVTLNPFQWNCCEILGSDNPSRVEPVIAWFHRWFRAEDDGSSEELLGAIHFMSDPEITDGVLRLTVDLGSSPVEALEELFDAAIECGAATLAVGVPVA
jgi:hypothetical protein